MSVDLILRERHGRNNKNELEIARFGAHAPRAGTVDVKRLI